jgi:acetyl-CoA carboxylase carboxyltransferase component
MAQKFTASELREQINTSASEARDFIRSFFDDGTFLERGTYVKNGEGYFESVITGSGSVDNRPVFAFVQDFNTEKGAFTAAHGKKITSLYDQALRAGAPMVAVFTGAGAKIAEGIDVLSSYGAVMTKVSAAKGVIPQIALIDGVCGGASAVLSQMFDIVIYTEKANRYVASRAEKTGKPHLVTDNAIADIRALLALLPSNCEEGNVCGDEAADINDAIDVSSLVEGDVRELLSAISDNAPIFLSESFGKEAVTALSTLNGRTVGFVANQPTENGGALTCCASGKLASFIDFCGSFGIPVVTLVNTKGLSDGCDLNAFSSLVFAYTSCPSPVVTAIVGKAYGSAFTLLGSKSLGADLVFALDSAVISVLDPDTAVEFVNDSELKASNDPAALRASLKDQWINGEASPLNAARSGDIDDVIDSCELKQRLASALEFLS